MLKAATEQRRGMREAGRSYRPEIAEEMAYSRANLEFAQLTNAQKSLRNLGSAIRRMLAAPDLAALQEMANALARDRRLGGKVGKIRLSKSRGDPGDLKRDLHDMLMVERSKLAKRVVQNIEGQRKSR